MKKKIKITPRVWDSKFFAQYIAVNKDVHAAVERAVEPDKQPAFSGGDA